MECEEPASASSLQTPANPESGSTQCYSAYKGLRYFAIDDVALSRLILERLISKTLRGSEYSEVTGAELGTPRKVVIEQYVRRTFELRAEVIILDQYIGTLERGLLGTHIACALVRAGYDGLICLRSADDSLELERQAVEAGVHLFIPKYLSNSSFRKQIFKALDQFRLRKAKQATDQAAKLAAAESTEFARPLPVHDEDKSKAQAKHPVKPTKSHLPPGLTMFAVEDNVLARKTLQILFKIAKGSDSSTVMGQSVDEILNFSNRVLESDPPVDICICDQNLDDPAMGGRIMQGTSIITNLLKGGFKGVLVIRSANDSKDDVEYYQKCGAHIVLRKTTSLMETLAIIASYWKMHQA
ncbi:hypothetical protein CYMTET_10136 [Cymbomonas tetramitiformis]|uniref:Response regulatory domain-containing protein n=1 Tax=Cymbomonas tetramitiformis TaxID=36881 RepID=A0AAE0GRA9_9CHLO|nr:hypothetical protein CYMTET_10136 [Cymbomonas tetramitiformis]